MKQRPARSVVTLGWVFAALAVLMAPWTAYLAVTLPSTHQAAHYDLAWTGFDVGLLVALALTGWAAVRTSSWLPALAGGTAAMLLVDGWFDTVTASTANERWVALGMAVLVEVPLAVLCGWLAVDGQQLFERRVRLSVRRRDRAAG
jgi:hypothetical protein